MFLAVVRTVSLVILQRVSTVLVRRITIHLAERQGAHVDAARADHAADFGMHESCVPALRLRARNGTVTRAVVVQELLGEVAASNSDGSSASNVPINEEGAVLSERPELRQNVLATRDHLHWVISVMFAEKETASSAPALVATRMVHLRLATGEVVVINGTSKAR